MIYFFSDVHLGFSNPEIERQKEDLLLNFLDEISKDAEKIIIVGDFFDYWFDWKRTIPKDYYRTLAKIDELIRKNIEIEYLIGNHDFGHYRFFKEKFGIIPIENDIERTYYNKKFYISHGDGKSNNDGGYRFIKHILRSKFNQSIYRILHPDFSIWLASKSSKKSRGFTSEKKYGKQDGMRDFAFKKIDEGYDYVIMGHRHKVEYLTHNSGAYINLGDWLNLKPHYASFDGNILQLNEINLDNVRI
ncbi:MAG TPA: UDP-2,3-diacylglucosamine diphosphatase [Candidatus Kapabacteria bacterium]|nr:UDP-2,3-diacylglucosamine diphosphatase [Candidatus Kapabacteria bacterium]HOV91840.1 UDP-2,3-diacylglucosamine diphosphatase [Candidatus Kapabacteria bacterium]